MTPKPDDLAAALVFRPPQELAATASLVKRGLIDLETRDIEAADWSVPTMRGWCQRNEIIEFFPDESPDKKVVEFCCDLSNNTDAVRCLQGPYAFFARSKATGRLTKLEDAYLSLLNPPIYLQPRQELLGFRVTAESQQPFKVCIVSLAFTRLFEEDREPDECLRDVLGDATTILAHDGSLETLIVIKLRQRKWDRLWHTAPDEVDGPGRWRNGRPLPESPS